MVLKDKAEMKDRTPANLNGIPRPREGWKGVYILFDRSMPVYVGKGNIKIRIKKHAKSERLGRFWDQFSWYIPHDQSLIGDLEAMLHCMLPRYPRLLIRRREKLKDKKGR